MRRFLPAAVVALLAVAVATPVQAGYLIIRVILEGSAAGSDPGGGFGGYGGYGGFGGEGGSPDGGGPGGNPGYGGAMGQPPRGGGALPGSPPGPGGGPATPGGPAAHDPTRSVVIVVPVTTDLGVVAPFYHKQLQHPRTNPPWAPKIKTTHRGQQLVTNLFTDSQTIQWYETLLQTPAPKKTRASEVTEQHDRWRKSNKSDPKLLFTALNAALEAGLVDDAQKWADELLPVLTAKKDSLPPDLAGFARAYGAMQKGIRGGATKPSDAADWQTKLDAQNLTPSPHYALISWDAPPDEVRWRSALLEENFKGFFLWHAVRGVELPVPDAPLVAVLAKKGADVRGLAKALDAPPWLVADGFFSPERNVLVLSPERLDDVGLTFAVQTRQLYREGANRQQLLEGAGPDLDVTGQKGKQPEEVARLQTLALVERLVEDAAAAHAVSREGSRQLLYATGLLPRHVTLPEWVSQGAVNTFARPKDPAFVTNKEGKNLMTVATATGYGGPNYVLQRYFRDLLEKEDLSADRAALLRNVITDAYFRGLRDPADPNDPDPPKKDDKGTALFGNPQNPGGGPMPGGPGAMPGPGGRPGGPGVGIPGVGIPGGLPGFGGEGGLTGMQPREDDPTTVLRKKRARLSIKSQATAWALYYYLASDRPAELRRFLEELAALPRDLPLDDATVLAAFNRAFNLDGSKAAHARFADGWLNYMRSLAPAGVDVLLVDPKPMGGTPGGPGGFPGIGPGGFPGAPGGGRPGGP